MKAVILAAGFATRLYPLTLDRAKPLLDVGGRPVLSWLADRILALESVDEVVIVVNGRFHAQFEAWLAGYRANVALHLVNDGAAAQPEQLGALGDLALALESIEDRGAPLFVAAGDNLVAFDLAPHAARFSADPSRPLLLVREIEGEVPPGRYSEVVLGPDGEVASFREKPSRPRSNLSAVGLYFLPADVREDLEHYMQVESNHDAPGYFLAWLAARRPLAAARLSGGWHDIGNLETLERARADFARRPHPS